MVFGYDFICASTWQFPLGFHEQNLVVGQNDETIHHKQIIKRGHKIIFEANSHNKINSIKLLGDKRTPIHSKNFKKIIIYALEVWYGTDRQSGGVKLKLAKG